MSFNTTHRKPRTAPDRPADIIIAADISDGLAYAERHGHNPDRAVIITPRNVANVRGRIGPVYATRKARLLPSYSRLIETARPAGSTLPRTARDRRVA